MTQDIFKICKSGNGLTLLGVNIPRGLSPDDVFFSVTRCLTLCDGNGLSTLDACI